VRRTTKLTEVGHRGLQDYRPTIITSTFFTFFALFHTFSRTMRAMRRR